MRQKTMFVDGWCVLIKQFKVITPPVCLDYDHNPIYDLLIYIYVTFVWENFVKLSP